MPGFTLHKGNAVVLSQDHIDTDRIIPARYLSRVERQGYGDLLFVDVRGGDFPLDQPQSKGASVMVVGTNFGCGSSREHAVWAIQQAGFKVVIARTEPGSPGYSDIFRQNAANCGMLLVELKAEDHARLVAAGSGAEVTVDLEGQSVSWGDDSAPFEIEPATKSQLLKGLDLIGMTLEKSKEITSFEKKWASFAPPSPLAGLIAQVAAQRASQKHARS